ncbi:MAG: hypothetical protein Q4D44_05310 [Eubacteriales bacterium]|nr:hypothetical protein [Eubacteriales bacterium]
MTRLAKPVSIIVAVLMVILSVLSLCGISYFEGDNKRTVIKGFGDIDWGLDVSGGSEFTLGLSTADEADVNSLYEAKDVIEERIAKFGLTDYDLYVDEGSERLHLSVPKSVNCEYSSEEVSALLASMGNMTIRPGNTAYENILDTSNSPMGIYPYGETQTEVLLSSEHVDGSSWFKYTESGEDYYYVTLRLNDEGKEILSSISNPDTGRMYNKTVSVWIDDRLLTEMTVNEHATEGYIQFSGLFFTESKAKLYSAIFDSGLLPTGLAIDDLNDEAPAVGGNASDIIMYSGIVLAVLIAVFMIVKYRLSGVVAALCGAFEFSTLVCVITGFCFGSSHTFLMTVPGAAALGLSVLITVLSMIIISERIREQLSAGILTEDAVSFAFRKSFKSILDINVTALIIGAVGMLMFGTAGITVDIFSGGAASGIWSFCFVMFFGALINFLSGYILPMLILRSLSAYKVFSKPSMFGGAK